MRSTELRQHPPLGRRRGLQAGGCLSEGDCMASCGAPRRVWMCPDVQAQGQRVEIDSQAGAISQDVEGRAQLVDK